MKNHLQDGDGEKDLTRSNGAKFKWDKLESKFQENCQVFKTCLTGISSSGKKEKNITFSISLLEMD
jgi:hypothetical protein